MRNISAIFRRELASYFATPVAYVFIIIFLLLTGWFTFTSGNFFDRGQADLQPFFANLPMLYLFLLPAVSMRLWSEERRVGTIELLMTLPVSIGQAVIAKYLAAWAFAAIALLLTFPIVITVNYLGDPDNGVILAGYIGSLLLGGAFLAIGACISAITKNQVIAFVCALVACLLFLLAGDPQVVEFFEGWPSWMVDAVSSMGFRTHFESISKGVVDLRDLIFFASLIVFFLFANAIVLEFKKAD